MDMSNGWVINKIWRALCHKWRHAAAAMRANNVLRNSYNTPTAMRAHNVLRSSYNTRPLLCVRITCYVIVIM
jgi:hypothetical protein